MPSAITQDYQVTIAPLADESLEFFMGSGTPYQIDKFIGLDVDDVRTDDQERLLDHGSFPGLDLLGSRGLTLGIVTFGTPGDPNSGLRTPSQVVSNQDALVGAWTAKSLDQAAADPTTPSMVLRYKLPGQAVRRFVGRCRKVARNDDTVPVGYASATLEFVALDPRQYAEDLASLTLKAGTATNLTADPSLDAVNGTVVVRTNIFANPRAVSTGSGHWSGTGGTGGTAAGAYQTGQSWPSGMTTSWRYTWTVASTAVNGGIFAGRQAAVDVPVTAGKTYVGYMQARCSKAQTIRGELHFYDAANTDLGGTGLTNPFAVGANTATGVSVPAAVAPAGATHALLYITSVTGGTTWAPGDWLEGTAAHIEETAAVVSASGLPLSGYFMGTFGAGTYGADYTYGWAGVADQSASQMRAPALTAYTAYTAGVVFRSTEQALFGAGSAKILMDTHGGALGSGFYQDYTGLTIGQDYVFSVYVYVPSSATGSIVIGASGMPKTAPMTTKDAWVRIIYQFTATATTHRLYPALNGGASTKGVDYAWVDGILLTQGTDVEPFLGTSSSGLLFPATFPTTFTPVNGSDLQVTNAGTFSSPPVITIQGPVTNPRVTNVEDGSFIQVNIALAATDILVINTDTRQVLLGGTSSRAYLLAVGSKWLRVRPGINTFRLGGTWATGDRPRLSVAFRSAWL